MAKASWLSTILLAVAVTTAHCLGAAATLRMARPVHVVDIAHSTDDVKIDPSPDGRWLCRWTQQGYTPNDITHDDYNYTLWISSTRHPHWRRVHDGVGVGSWRADSGAYTFVSRNKKRTRNRIVMVSVPSFRVRTMRSPFGHPELPTWSPDGKSIAVLDCPDLPAIYRGLAKANHVMNTDCEDTFTDTLCVLTTSGRCVHQVSGLPWTPHDTMAFSPNGRHIALVSVNYRIGDMGQLAVVDVDTGKVEIPYEHNPTMRDGDQEDSAEPITFANDGRLIAISTIGTIIRAIQCHAPFKMGNIGKSEDASVAGPCIVIDAADGPRVKGKPAARAQAVPLRYRQWATVVDGVTMVDVDVNAYRNEVVAVGSRWVWVFDHQRAVGYRIGK